jgi:hypothetical protein
MTADIISFRPRQSEPEAAPYWHLVAALFLTWGAIFGMGAWVLARLLGWL